MELVKDSEGAYSQLIQLQEIRSISDQSAFNDQNRQEITIDSGRHSSHRISLLRSISGGSSGTGNSSPHSFSVSLVVPTLPNTSVSAPSQVPQEVSLRRLALLNKPEMPVLLLGSIAAIANGMVLPAYGVLLSGMVKSFFEPENELRKDSKLWALVFVGLGVAALLTESSKSYLLGVAGCKLIQRVRSMCFEKVVYMEISWFDEAENSSGAISARLSADAASVRGLVGDTLAFLVQNIATAIAGLIVSFEACWQLALVILVMLPLQGINGYVHIKFLAGFSADAKVLFKLHK